MKSPWPWRGYSVIWDPIDQPKLYSQDLFHFIVPYYRSMCWELSVKVFWYMYDVTEHNNITFNNLEPRLNP